MIAQIMPKIRNMIKRGLVTLDRTNFIGQTSYLGKTSNYEAIKPYGFDSIPKQADKPLVLLFAVNANESQKIGLEYNNKMLFKTITLNPGEVVVYNPGKQTGYLLFKNDEKTVLHGKETHLVGEKVAIGNSSTELLKQLEDILDGIVAHLHPSVMGPTGAPNNAATFTAIKDLITAIKGTIE